MIVLPEGIYHRFTLDEHDYIKVRTEAARTDAHPRAEGGRASAVSTAARLDTPRVHSVVGQRVQ